MKAIAKFEAEAGCASGSIFAAAAKRGADGAFPRLERGELSLEEFLPIFGQELSESGVAIKQDLAQLFAYMEEGFAPPRPEMLLAIQSLKAEGVRTAALTTTGRERVAKPSPRSWRPP